MPWAVVLDTVSIQNFIFSTNNLRENLGASELVKSIYEEPLIEALREVYPDFDLSMYNAWEREDLDLNKFPLNQGAKAEVAYIGGGNAVLFFESQEMATDFVSSWSKLLLVYAPSLTPASAIEYIDFNSFSDGQRKLFRRLAENKSKAIALTTIPTHGITAECPRTGLSCEIWADILPEDERGYISSTSYAKLEFSKKAKQEHEKILKEINLSDEYCFTDVLEELGQKEDESNYIAIVHIDGNDMTNRFRSLNSIAELRRLSSSVKRATITSFKDMLKELVELIPRISASKRFEFRQEDGRKVLPLRPIVIGGDDITFVSEGRLGLWLARVFLEKFSSQEVSDKKPLSACAGVVITKTKYPFYRGYRLSEELLKNAKKVRKEKGDNGSWLDFHITTGGISGSIEEIRQRQCETVEGKLYMRPYEISEFDMLVKGARYLNQKDKEGKSKFPRSKIHRIVNVLYSSKSSQRLLEEEFRAKGLKLPIFGDKFSGEELMIDRETPYLDMIEILDFYPLNTWR